MIELVIPTSIIYMSNLSSEKNKRLKVYSEIKVLVKKVAIERVPVCASETDTCARLSMFSEGHQPQLVWCFSICYRQLFGENYVDG